MFLGYPGLGARGGGAFACGLLLAWCVCADCCWRGVCGPLLRVVSSTHSGKKVCPHEKVCVAQSRRLAHMDKRARCSCFAQPLFPPLSETVAVSRQGFEYATYNDAEDLKRVVKRINRRGKIRSLFGRPRRAVAAIMMEALQVSRSVRQPATKRGVTCSVHILTLTHALDKKKLVAEQTEKVDWRYSHGGCCAQRLVARSLIWVSQVQCNFTDEVLVLRRPFAST